MKIKYKSLETRGIIMLKNRIKQFLAFIIIYVIIIAAFFFIAQDQIKFTTITSNEPTAVGLLPEVSQGTLVEQSFYSSTDILDYVSVMTGTYGRENTGTLEMSLLDGATYEVLSHKSVPVNELKDDLYIWAFDNDITEARNRQFIFRIESTCPQGLAPTIYYANLEEGSAAAWLNYAETTTQLVFQFSGRNYSWFGHYYWEIFGIIGLLALAYMVVDLYKEKKGKCTLAVLFNGIWEKYEFLIKQLVVRDFKTKYKRSVLGYLWSFLNPLLTMIVQYLIFSSLFKQDIENFPVYLLTGTILFSFFQEAVGQGLNSILANASLITKVYMPKYIYPVTKVVSSSINLLISVIPLILVTLITGEKITPAFLLIPFALLCLILFCIGLSLILSSAMVFFRDTQYLWGIVSLMWMYATPIFYPESILPEQYQVVLKLNPLYHMVKFVRVILIDGVSPEPRRYVYCLISAIVTCVIGAIIFKKTQDKFILYI